jgi:ParB-like chromosome segregation protein Spo0J
MAAKTKPPPEPVDPAAVHRQWPASKIELRLIRSLTPYASNPRVHSPQQVNQIIASIKEWGWTIPILIDEGGTIIAGHGRAMAAEKMGLAEVPVMIARGWTDAQKRAYVIADNQLTINASWDEPLLRIELGELKKLDFELGLVGFDEVRLATFIGGNPGNGDPRAILDGTTKPFEHVEQERAEPVPA